MDWLCLGAGFWVVLAIIGFFALAALAILLVKLGVIIRYASRQEPPDTTADYTLDESKESESRGEEQ